MTSADNTWLHRPDQVWKPVFGGRVAAEIGALAAATGIVPLVNAIAPERYGRLKHHFAQMVVKPHAEWLEKHVFNSPAFVITAKEMKDVTDPEKRADLMAGALIDFAVMLGASIATQTAVQSKVGRMAGLPDLVQDANKGFFGRRLQHSKNMLKPVLFDKTLNVGLVTLMQVGLPQTTKNITESTSNVLQKTLGVPPEATQYFLQWQVPHLVGFSGSALMLSRKYSDFLKNLAAKSAAAKL